jgi:hypothetical protein
MAFRLRQHARGKRTRPQRVETGPQPDGRTKRAELDETPVATWTMTLPVVPAPTVALAGLKVQTVLLGSEPQLNAKIPEEPFEGLRATVNRAV